MILGEWKLAIYLPEDDPPDEILVKVKLDFLRKKDSPFFEMSWSNHMMFE